MTWPVNSVDIVKLQIYHCNLKLTVVSREGRISSLSFGLSNQCVIEIFCNLLMFKWILLKYPLHLFSVELAINSCFVVARRLFIKLIRSYKRFEFEYELQTYNYIIFIVIKV